jgi:phosphoglycerate dehydrogenase-like enzyme
VTILDPLTWSHGWSYDIEDEILAAAGVDLAVPKDEADRDRLIAIADAVISSSLIALDATWIDRMERCSVILCYSAGMDAVDIEAAHGADMLVGNVNASTEEVADHTMMLLLAAERRLGPMLHATGEGRWDLAELPDVAAIRRIRGQTLGIVGVGLIGRAVASRARAFGYQTIGTRRRTNKQIDEQLPIVPLDELVARSQAIVITAALTSESHHLIGAEQFALMTPGTILVNTARGGLIDEQALADALDDGTVAVAALDVRDPEPPDHANDPLAGRTNVLSTPHMAAASDGSRTDLHRLAAENTIAMLRHRGLLR